MLRTSESLKNLAGALKVFHDGMGKVIKENTGGVFGNKYADLATVLDATKEPLSKANLVLTQHPSGVNELTTLLIHTESGEFIESSYTLTPTKNDPQGQGSVITYARRYAWGAILGLNIDVDDDLQKPAPKPASSPKKKEPEVKVVYPPNEINPDDIPF